MDTLDTFQSNFFDYDLFGEIKDGSIKTLYERDALINSLRLWISSKQGDFIGGRTRGGYVRKALNRPMSETDSVDVYQAIMTGLTNDFSPTLEIISLNVVPNLEKRRWEINLDAYAPSLKQRIEVKESLKEGSNV